ncbi:hypothetical protein LMG28614_02041 [Paraburkholderia ultramafica]|uniref:NAD-specific glutamate dehydrogenase n=1 Tax=Paraburkholderia ultramafica TaxID=1544867 RepID=A0A6S7BDA3_9BURK|nr:hypothetical protein LMG28614_02041 [Paraburkholderia ultramafica]
MRRAGARGTRRRGSGVGEPLAILFDQFVERQIQHVVAVLAVHKHLGRIRIDLLHGFHVHARANHSGRFRVLCEDLLEAVGLALRLRHRLLAIGFRLFDLTRHVGLRTRQQIRRIGLRITLRAFVFLMHFGGVVERGLHLVGHLHALNRHTGHGEAGLVLIEGLLDRRHQLLAHCFAILIEDLVRAGRADNAAHRRLRGVHHALIGIDAAKQIIGGFAHLELHREAHFDDVTVVREHRRVLHIRETHHVVAADLDLADLADIDELMCFERIRQTPVHTLPCRVAILAELHHDRSLAILHDEHAAAEIDRNQHADHDAHADARTTSIVRTATARTAALASEDAAQAAVEITPHLVEIGRTFTVPGRTLGIVRPLPVAIAVAPAPARIVQ